MSILERQHNLHAKVRISGDIFQASPFIPELSINHTIAQ